MRAKEATHRRDTHTHGDAAEEKGKRPKKEIHAIKRSRIGITV